MPAESGAGLKPAKSQPGYDRLDMLHACLAEEASAGPRFLYAVAELLSLFTALSGASGNYTSYLIASASVPKLARDSGLVRRPL